MATNQRTMELLRHLAGRPGHDEVKADFRQLLMEEFGAEIGALDFERRVPEVKGRLDALIGRTIFEAKSNVDREWPDVLRRMPDYLADREREEGEAFVGIASDGLKWVVFERQGETLAKVKETLLDPERPEPFLAFLDGALALKGSLAPDALNVRAELGQESIAFRRASARLAELWARLANDNAAALKRSLWSSLLKLVYGREIESDALWLQHTYLVIVAKAIGLAILRVQEDDPKRLLSGAAFEAHNIFGAVESDFFDWVVALPEGEDLVRRILAHVRRFRLSEVKSDVLKILYESLIDRAERHGLGEYYTPDWLAAKVVRRAVDQPLDQRVLDPACGSGTFLFHAIRNFLAEAEESGLAEPMWAAEATRHVAGMDIHPVAVIIARVTYVMALAPALDKREGGVSIPVYLGDAMQLSISQMFAGKELTIRVPPPPAGQSRSGEPNGNGGETLDFPDTFCRDPELFDKAIARMRSASEQALSRQQVEAALVRIVEQHYKRDINREEKTAITDLGKTYLVFDRLRRENRDSVWAYVARNLSRPLAFSAGANWASVVVGNPPWVAYRHMSADLQKRFKELAKGERVHAGGKFATQNDLCALFMVRATGLYLKAGGRIAFVLPLAVLSRGQFEPFRKGSFTIARLQYDEVWTMDDSVQPLFPVPSCVVFARRRAIAKAMPDKVRAYSGALPWRDAPEAVADERLEVMENAPKPTAGVFEGGSPYRRAFRDGATLYPRFLCLVGRGAAPKMLGTDRSAPYVVSRRGGQDKEPWKLLPSIESRVEAAFLYPVYMGESILPFRLFRSFEGIVPVNGRGSLLDAKAAADEGWSGLHNWMRQAEAYWQAHAESDLTLVGRWNYHNELGAQFPVSNLRVVYAKSGTLPAACVLRDERGVVDHMLYWAKPGSEDEAYYLLSVLNSELMRGRVAKLQARGQWGARHFDKVMFTERNFARFDPKNRLHRDLAAAGREAEEIAAAVPLPEGVKFQRARKLVREALLDVSLAARIDSLVARLLDGA